MAQRMTNAVRSSHRPGPRMADVGLDLTELFAGGGGFQNVTTTPATVTAGKCAVGVSAAGAVTVNLPAGIAGQRIVVVDTAGDASDDDKTIVPNGAQTIGGGEDLAIAVNGGAADLLFIGTNWIVLPGSTLT
jgi:hypothetical protein